MNYFKRYSFIYFLSFLIIMIIGYGLLTLKNLVKNLQQEVKYLQKQIDLENVKINLTRAELTYLTNPNRLRVLVDKYLDLEEITLSQIDNKNNKNLVIINQEGVDLNLKVRYKHKNRIHLKNIATQRDDLNRHM